MGIEEKWDIWENGDGEIGVELNGCSICTIESINNVYGIKQMKEYAKLIAKVPELLLACKDAKEFILKL